MSVFNLRKIFDPEVVAIVGATERRGSVGSTVVRNLTAAASERRVYAVNPNHERVHGVPCYGSVADLPETPDLAVVALPARAVAETVRQCGEAAIPGLVILSAGFGELGEEGARLQEQIREEIRGFEGMRAIGPNCLGVIAPHVGLNASFAAAMPDPGRVAFVSQSGALCTAVLDWARDEGVGFSYFVSIGNMIDVDFGDLIDFLAGDPETDALILYVESIQEARKFMSAARAFTRTKPIIAYKAGRHAASAKAAASHTGALAGEDTVYRAAFERAGIVRILDSGDMFDCAELLARHPRTRGERVAVVSNAGGPGVMATDALIDREGVLAELSEETVETLDAILPAAWSRGNPVDVLGDASPERYRRATEVVLADGGVDAGIVILTPQAMTDPTGAAQAVAEVAGATEKPVLACWMGGASIEEGMRHLNEAGVPTYATPEYAVDAFMYLVSHDRNQEILYETPRDLAGHFTHREEAWKLLEEAYEPGRETLSELTSKALLDSYGIPCTRPRVATSRDEAVEHARDLGYPVVLKVHSPDITHKTDVGGVALDLQDDEAVRAAFERVSEAAMEARPEAHVAGVTVQRMVTSPEGFEIILGSKKDPTFGSALMVGTGGIAAEVLRDRSLGLPPVDERIARRMLESLRAWPLLEGYRGRPRLDIDALTEIVVRFSYLLADLPQVAELDVNPLLVTPEGAIALDARVILDAEVMRRSPAPYEHLVIRPYPESYVRQATLRDGTAVTLRPIRPEDEPKWLEMLEQCSETTLRRRFRYLFRGSHELAVRYCFIDYERELALVAETEVNGEERLVGVGRLVADRNHETAEYAVLVADAWQGRGLGNRLTDACLEIAEAWGVRRVLAYVTPENAPMLHMFEKRSFRIEGEESEGEIAVSRQLGG